MRIPCFQSLRRRHERSGFAVIILLALLFIMVGLAAVNNAAIHSLRADVKRLDQSQAHRLAVWTGGANVLQPPRTVTDTDTNTDTETKTNTTRALSK